MNRNVPEATRPFQCPTRIVASEDVISTIAPLVSGRAWALVTSQGWVGRGVVDRLVGAAGPGAIVIDDVVTHPGVETLARYHPRLLNVECIVAVGGGSVIDAAKLLAAAAGLAPDRIADAWVGSWRLPDHARVPSLIAVPTTTGTGSEVTAWATVWGPDRRKYSLADPRLFPEYAILDPALCRSMPRAVALASGLDAMSHAMEAVWNRHHMPVSDALALSAIRTIHDRLPRFLEAPDDALCRGEMQWAALHAGLAMSTTMTALAHSLSYPLTTHFGLPHGLACSFTLGEVARFNIEAAPGRVALVATAFGVELAELPTAIHAWLGALDIAPALGRHLRPHAAAAVVNELINPARASNNIRPAAPSDGLAIIEASLRSLGVVSTEAQNAASDGPRWAGDAAAS